MVFLAITFSSSHFPVEASAANSPQFTSLQTIFPVLVLQDNSLSISTEFNSIEPVEFLAFNVFAEIPSALILPVLHLIVTSFLTSESMEISPVSLAISADSKTKPSSILTSPVSSLIKSFPYSSSGR